MNKKIGAILGVIGFVALMGIAVYVYNTNKGVGKENQLVEQKTEQGDNAANSSEGGDSKLVKAPDFKAKSQNGEMVSLSSYKGKPTIISFWATWCPNCKIGMPAFQKIYDEMGSEVNILMVNVTDGVQEKEKNATEYIKNKGYTFPVLYDIDQEAAYQYGVNAIPMTYFINAEGYVVTAGSGALDEELIKKGIGMIK